MSTDARISTGLPGHPKTKKLIRRLGPAAGWSLLCLILWARANRPNGDLAGMSVEDIELACDWTGESDAFVNALVAVGFLDGTAGAYRLHDWAEHQPWANGSDMRSAKARWNAVKRHHGTAEADRQVPEWAAVRASSTASSTESDASSNADRAATSNAAAMHVAANSNAPSPSPSPSPSPNTPLTPQGGTRPRKSSRTPEEETADLTMFEHHFWPAYPKKADKQAAFRAWRKLRVTPELLARMLAGLELWKRHQKWTKDGGEFRHNPATWLNNHLWEDEEVCGSARPGSENVPQWVTAAGFDSEAHAANFRCYAHNASEFRAGKRVAAEAAA